MVNHCFAIIGGNNAGKSRTIREWRNLKTNLKKGDKAKRRFGITFNDENILAFVLISSPHERFHHILSEIMDYFKKIIPNYLGKARKEGFNKIILVVAFNSYISEGRLKTENITEPLNLFREKGFNIHKVYLKYKKIKGFSEIDNYMNRNNDKTIERIGDNFKERAKILDEFIKSKL